MTTNKDKPILDGFGRPVTEDVGMMTVMYGVAPYPYPTEPFSPFEPTPPITTPPIVIPPAVTPRGDGYMLTVTGPLGSVFSIALTEAERQAVRGKILEALK